MLWAAATFEGKSHFGLPSVVYSAPQPVTAILWTADRTQGHLLASGQSGNSGFGVLAVPPTWADLYFTV